MRSFVRIRDTHGIQKLRLHAIRHPTASLLKDLKVPPRDAQIILGQAHISTTQQIYTHVDKAARRKALTRLNKLLGGTKCTDNVVSFGGQPPISRSRPGDTAIDRLLGNDRLAGSPRLDADASSDQGPL